MRYLLLFLLAVVIFVAGRQSFQHFYTERIVGKGPIVTETRSVGSFHALALECAGNLTVTISPDIQLSVSAHENILPMLQTDNEGGVLKIYLAGNAQVSGPIDVKISCPTLDAVDMTGSGKLVVAGLLQSEKFRADLNGSGELIMAEAALGEAKLEITGSGNIRVGGRIANLQVNINGSGDVQSDGLKTERCFADISGSGSVHCGEVAESLRAVINGSGDIFYSGNPALTQDVMGSGKLIRQ